MLNLEELHQHLQPGDKMTMAFHKNPPEKPSFMGNVQAQQAAPQAPAPSPQMGAVSQPAVVGGHAPSADQLDPQQRAMMMQAMRQRLMAGPGGV